MNAGRLDQLAPPAELYAAPATSFVGQFVGLSNRIPARAADGGAEVLGTVVRTLPGSADGPGVALVRPESVRVTPDAAGTTTVAAVAFLGPISRATLTLADGTLVLAQLPSSEAAGLSVGDRVTVSVDPVPVLVVAD
jgi:putative spermidine/putrescine transport system ATP-binding protein